MAALSAIKVGASAYNAQANAAELAKKLQNPVAKPQPVILFSGRPEVLE